MILTVEMGGNWQNIEADDVGTIWFKRECIAMALPDGLNPKLRIVSIL